MARATVLKVPTERDRAYRCTYSSASLLGLKSVVQPALTVAGLALCSVPQSQPIIGTNEGLLPMDVLEISILPSPLSTGTAVERLCGFLHRELSRNSWRPSKNLRRNEGLGIYTKAGMLANHQLTRMPTVPAVAVS